MVLGSGLFAGLLGQIAHAIGNHGLERAAHIISWLLPFEALYQDALALTTADQGEVTQFLVRWARWVGVAGRWLLLLYAVGYVAVVGVIAVLATSKRDL